MWPFEFVAMPATSPRYSLSGSLRKFGTESNGISGTFNCAPPYCCCAERPWPKATMSSAPRATVNVRFIVSSLARGCRGRRRARRRLRVQDDVLHAPRGDLRDPQVVVVAAVHAVNRRELLHLLAGLAELAEHRAVELHLVDLA